MAQNSIIKKGLFFLSLSLFLSSSCNTSNAEDSSVSKKDLYSKIENANAIEVDGEILAELTSPPNVPAPLGDRSPKKVRVNLEIIEKGGVLADGVSYLYWTFGGTVPGSFIRVKAGDEVDFHLQNRI